MTQGFDIDELERLLAAATPGEWVVTEGVEISAGNLGAIIECMYSENQEADEANASLIVTLVNNLPAILTEIRELRAENARLKWWQDEVLKLQSDHYGNGVMTHLRLSEFCDDARAMRALAALGEPQ